MNHSETAHSLVCGDRNAAYGSPDADFRRIAAVWTGIIGEKLAAPISSVDVALMMTGLKLVRHAHKAKDDNLIDAHGYLICAEWIETGVRPVSEAQAAKAMVETICTGERLQCEACGQSMPCMCEHKP